MLREITVLPVEITFTVVFALFGAARLEEEDPFKQYQLNLGGGFTVDARIKFNLRRKCRNFSEGKSTSQSFLARSRKSCNLVKLKLRMGDKLKHQIV